MRIGHEVEKTLEHFLTGCQAWSSNNEFWFIRKSPLCDGINAGCNTIFDCCCENVNWSSCFCDPINNPPKIPHNQGAAMGRTIHSIFLASLTGYSSTKPPSYYNDKIYGMAGYLKNNLKEKNGSSGDYYTWCYQGTGCFNGNGDYEDVSHATLTMDFARLCSRNNIIFNASDMEKFANTFKENIHVRHGVYNDAVDGSNGVGPCDDSRNCKWVIPRWAFLGMYDDFVYLSASQVTSQYLFCDLPMDCNISERYKDVSLLSIARLCYYRDCFEYQSNDEGNRELIAPDQKRNFYSPTHSSFGDYLHVSDDFPPMVNTRDFVIEEDEVTRIVSGDRIELLPGFHAKEGSKFHAHISGEDCSSNKSRKIMNGPKGKRRSVTRSDRDEEAPKQGELLCYPNPTDNVFDLVFRFEEEKGKGLKKGNGKFLLIDPQGRVVSEHQFPFTELTNGVRISVADLNCGVYIGKLIKEGHSRIMAIKKVVIK